MLLGRIIIIFLLSVSFANAKYYKCFYSKDDVIDYSNHIALFVEEDYISVMDNIYHVNADFVEVGHDAKGDFSVYKKEAQDFLYKAKFYEGSLSLVLVRKNLLDNKIFPETIYTCKNPDTMQDQMSGTPLITSPALPENKR